MLQGGANVRGGPSEREGNFFLGDDPICDDSWGSADANVACKMLGFPGAQTYTTRSEYGSVSSVFVMDDVSCGGSEDSLYDCNYNPNDNCGSTEGAGVICNEPASGAASVIIRKGNNEVHTGAMDVLSSTEYKAFVIGFQVSGSSLVLGLRELSSSSWITQWTDNDPLLPLTTVKMFGSYGAKEMTSYRNFRKVGDIILPLFQYGFCRWVHLRRAPIMLGVSTAPVGMTSTWLSGTAGTPPAAAAILHR